MSETTKAVCFIAILLLIVLLDLLSCGDAPQRVKRIYAHHG